MKTTIRLTLASAVLTLLAASPALAQTKLTMYISQFYAPEVYPELSAATQALVDEYEALHPDVEIEISPFIADVNAYQAWLTTRFAAGDEPDIVWQQFYQRNAERGENWLALNDYLEGPNPYIEAGQPGADRWGDIFFDNVQAQIRAGDGNWYQISTNWVETGFYVNNKMLADNGVDATAWKSWSDMIESCKTLRANGVQPIGVFMTPEWSTYQWLDDIIVTGAFADAIQSWYLEKYNNEFLPWRQLNQEEFAKAVKEGKFSTTDPRFDTYLALTKEVADHCLVEGFAGIPEYDSLFNMFYNQQVAMVWLGSWTAPSLKDVTFEVGSTYMPPFTKKESPYAIHDTSYRVGGPSSSGQFGLAARTAERGTADVAIDFLKFFTAPANYQKLANADEGYVPVIEGVEPTPVATAFQDIALLPERGLTDPIGRLNPQFGTEHNRLMQSFMLGEIDAAQLKQQYQRALDRAVQDLCADNEAEWAWCAE
jgi:ABC-type glycerol-3-phosphate transport system substrate-binding protein